MQADTKKQLPVLIALSAILVLAVGYSVVKSMSASSRPAVQKTAKQPEKTASATDASQASVQPELTYHFVGNPPRDPFEPQTVKGSAAAAPAASGSVLGPQTSSRVSVDRRPASGGKRQARAGLPPFPLPGLTGAVRVEGPSGAGFSSTGLQTANAQPAGDDRPPIRATGVIRGEQDLAVLRSDGGGRYFVRRGQSVGDGYVVAAIHSDGVVLRGKGREFKLELGEGKDARSNDRPRPASN